MPATNSTKRFYHTCRSSLCAKSSLDDGNRARHAIELEEDIYNSLFALKFSGQNLAVDVRLAMRADWNALPHLFDVTQVQVCQHELGVLVRGIANHCAPVTCLVSNTIKQQLTDYAPRIYHETVTE